MPEQERHIFGIDQIRRYQRQMVMPEVGGEGQRKLLQARVLLVGVGDLGSPAALYLASSGIGRLGIVDDGVVSVGDLIGQILYGHKDIGKTKVDVAKERLKDRNPDTQVVTYKEQLTSKGVIQIFQEYDLALNCSDSPQVRYLINDATYLSGKPFIDGSVLEFGGRVTTYIPGEGCYRCEHPIAPQLNSMPTEFEVIALGAVSGLIGAVQASEAIKLILDTGDTLKNRALLLEGLGAEFKTIERKRDPNCQLCGDNPTIKELIDL